MTEVTIQPALSSHFDEIWPIYHDVIQSADTYCDAAETPKEDAFTYWFGQHCECFIAVLNQKIVGACVIRPNHKGYGSHISNASFIVDKTTRGLGVGKKLGEFALEHAKKKGFKAMQFNFVVSTNTKAVELWKSLGFNIIGTIPQAFQHGTLGLVDAYIMHRFL